MRENDNFALVPRPAGAVERAEPGTKRVLTIMVADILALTPSQKAKLSTIPKRFAGTAPADENRIFNDLDWQAASAAEAVRDWDKSLKHSKVLVARYPNSPYAYFGLGLSFQYLNLIDDAIAAYQRSVGLKQNYEPAWCNLGLMCREAGRIDEAIAACQQAIKLKPDLFAAWLNLGLAYGESGHTGEAIQALRQATEIEPDDAQAWYNLGVAFDYSGQTEDAITAYRQAIKLKPDFTQALHNCDLACRKSNASRTR